MRTIHSLSSALISPQAVQRSAATKATGLVSSVGSTPAGSGSSTSSSSSDALGSATLSSFAQFLSKLQNLAKTNPTQEKAVLSDVANKLQAQAQSATGDAQTRLSQLADRFQQAAQTGDLSQLQPQTASAAGGGFASRARSAYQQNSGVEQSVLDVLNSESL